MKSKSFFSRTLVAMSVVLAQIGAFAGTDTWIGGGGGGNPFWLSTANWNPAGIPQAGDDLVFTNTISLVNSNNIPSASFNSITFATPSGAFDLKGNTTTVTDGITNNQPVTIETIEFPIIVNGAVNVDVAANGNLALTNAISGSGSLSKSSAGVLTLNGRNTFTGPLTVNGGTVAISAETNLPEAPVTPTAGNIVINGGTLQALTSFAINTNHGIALGPTSGSGQGAISVNNQALIPNQYTILTNGSVMANNGSGTGGLTKLGFGNLILFGTDTYTGTTSNEVGTLTLDFSRTASTANIISSSSPLVMGGTTAGAGVTNFAALIITNSSGTISQTFNGTHVTTGGAVIRVSGGGTPTLALGALDHDTGGNGIFVLPAAGHITTTTANTHGILGGWATIASGSISAGWNTETNWAANDGSGNIVNFNNFGVYSSGYVKNIMGADSNIDIPSGISGVAHAITNDLDNAGSVENVNTITVDGPGIVGFNFLIGSNNTVRLGQYGGLMNRVNAAGLQWQFGGSSSNVDVAANGTTNQMAQGFLTAGGPNNDTPGEINIISTENSSGSTASWAIDAIIRDNGAGPVTLVQSGPGYIKYRNHNIYSGGTYILGGRLQIVGTDIGTANYQDGLGTGPINIFPGAYLYLGTSGSGFNLPATTLTNDIYMAGLGTALEADGALRAGNNNTIASKITLIGDSGIGGGTTNAPALITGPISGPFNMYFGAEGNSGGGGTGLILSNQCNWTGNTYIVARLNSAGANTRVALGENNALPSGFGVGSLTIGVATDVGNTLGLDLNGFNQTINGLNSGSAPTLVAQSQDIVCNSSNGTMSTLTFGGNDQGGLWGGVIEDNSLWPGNGTPFPTTARVAITKIGGGIEIFTNVNTYSGNTTISNGVLQLTGSGSINNSTNVSINGGTFDVSASAYTVPSSQNINISGGTWFISTASGASSSVSITNGTLKVATLNTVAPNLTASTINLGSGANLIQPVTMPLIDTYPKTFVVASYTTLNGIDHTNSLGVILPAGGFPAFAGYVTVDTVHNQILLVATNGPITPSLTWAGFNYNTLTLDGNWNFVDPDWTNKPAHTKTSYTDGSLLTFDDSGLSSTVNLTTTFVPVGVTVANTNVNYTFIGTGAIVSTNGVTKLGSGKLTLDETGGDSYNGLTIAAGTVQIGINDNGGSVGTNLVGNNGTLVFNRANSVLNISNTISGSGSLLVSNAASTTTVLSGSSSFSGDVYVVPNVTLIPANSGALSSTNGTLTIPTGATLDVGGQGVAGIAVEKVVSVQGAGVDGTSGAIVNNTTTNQTTALLRVSLAGDTTVGGIGRFDIRGTGASLRGAFNLIKKGTGQFSLVGTAVDPAVENIDVQAGTFSVETTTTGLGNPADTLTIETPAMLQVYNATNQLNKQIVLNGNGSTTTLTNGNGNNTIAGPMTLGGTGPVLVAGGANTTLTLSNAISGGGSLTKNSLNTLVLTGPDTGGANDTYTGTTIVNDGTLVINGINSGSILTENLSATSVAGNVATVGGNGTNGAATDIEDTLWPGVAGKPATFGAGNNDEYNGGDGALVFNDSGAGVPRAVFSLNTSTTAGGGVNDLVTVNGDFNGNFSTHVFINPQTPLTVAGTPYTLVTYTGIKQNNFNGTAAVVGMFQPSRYSFSLDYSTTGVVKLDVLTGAGNLIWNNNAGNGIWDANVSANWLNTGTSLSDVFLQLDTVTFDDSIGGGQTTINLATNLVPGSVTVNSTLNYTFTGAGSISGAVNLIKQGSGTLNINNSNNFTGTVTVSGGTLAANTNNALGSSALVVYGGTLQVNAPNSLIGPVLVTNGTLLVNAVGGLGDTNNNPIYITNSGTLDVGGPSFGVNQSPLLATQPVYVSGWGINSNGCIINSSTNGQDQAFENLTLVGNAAIGGNGSRWDVGRPTTGSGVFSTGGNSYNLYKVGSNYVAFLGLTVDTNLANIDIQAGTLAFQQAESSMGNPASNITVEAGATLEFYNSTTNFSSYTKQFVLNGDGVTACITNENGATTINGSMTLNGACIIGVTGTALTNNCVISGGGSLTKNATAVLVLTTNETYTGTTTVSAGTLSLVGTATINNSPNINIVSSTVDVTGRTNNTLTLAGSQTFSGFGIINGTLTAPSGTTVTVGTNGAVGQLTVTTNANLSGILNMKLNKGGATNDVLSVGGQVNYGGALILNTNLSGALLVAGDSFKLFNATTYSGSFASISPAHPNNDLTLNWDTSSLTVDGSLKVAGSGAGTFTNPTGITGISLVGVNVVVTGTNGQSGDAYYLLQSTNVALPLSQWKTIATNVLGANGNYTFIGTNAVTSGDQQQFYILSNTNSNPQ